MNWWKIKTASSGVKGTTGNDYADYQGSEKGKRLCSYSFIFYRSFFLFPSNCKTEQDCSAGVISSKNYPANYPNKNRRTQRIKVGKGNTVTLKFTAFDVEPGGPKCNYDHLSIADGDGTVLISP